MTDLILISEPVVRTFSVDKVFRPATLLKKRLWHRCFPLNFAKFLRTSLFYRTPPIAASVISCLPISRSLFYHLDVNDTSCYTLNITVQIFSLKYMHLIYVLIITFSLLFLLLCPLKFESMFHRTDCSVIFPICSKYGASGSVFFDLINILFGNIIRSLKF